MKPRAPLLAGLAVAILLAGCSTVDSRIARNRQEFDSWPPEVQEKVAAGEIGIGFTPEQVLVALGEPDRRFTRTNSDGTSAVWSYREKRPRIGFGIGLGVGGFSGSRSVGGGVMLGTGYEEDEYMGVVFDRSGRVSAIEVRR